MSLFVWTVQIESQQTLSQIEDVYLDLLTLMLNKCKTVMPILHFLLLLIFKQINLSNIHFSHVKIKFKTENSKLMKKLRCRKIFVFCLAISRISLSRLASYPFIGKSNIFLRKLECDNWHMSTCAHNNQTFQWFAICWCVVLLV